MILPRLEIRRPPLCPRRVHYLAQSFAGAPRLPLPPHPKPKFHHPPEVYAAIIREHRDNPVRMAERLQACGWTLADAAWAAVHWDLRTLAAAVANERANRDAKITSLSESELAKLRAEIGEGRKPPATPKPRKTTRIIRTTTRLTPRPPARG